MPEPAAPRALSSVPAGSGLSYWLLYLDEKTANLENRFEKGAPSQPASGQFISSNPRQICEVDNTQTIFTHLLLPPTPPTLSSFIESPFAIITPSIT